MLFQAILAARRRLVILVGVFLESFRVGRVYCGDDGEVVLEFLKVLVGGCACVVEGVVEAWVEGTETQFVDLVGEVECCEYCVRRER